ncbi:MAG TPA: hypothetical protein VF147_01720 [Vicinamibacterales bacterium]
MKRFALSVAASLVVVLAAPAAFAQATKAAPQDKKPAAAVPATPTAAAPAAPTKYYKPVKGVAAIQTILGKSNKVGNEIVTTVKIKNMSAGSIALLQCDEYWYAGKEVVTGDTQRWRKPFNPGEIIEITFHSPYKPGLTQSQYQYSHANGKIDVKSVKKFD